MVDDLALGRIEETAVHPDAPAFPFNEYGGGCIISTGAGLDLPLSLSEAMIILRINDSVQPARKRNAAEGVSVPQETVKQNRPCKCNVEPEGYFDFETVFNHNFVLRRLPSFQSSLFNYNASLLLDETTIFIEIFTNFLKKLFISPCQIRVKFFSKKIFLPFGVRHFFVTFSPPSKNSSDFPPFGMPFALVRM